MLTPKNDKERLAVKLNTFLNENRDDLTDEDIADVYFTGALAFLINMSRERRTFKYGAYRQLLSTLERIRE